jgi:hypothetical protein
MIIFPIPDCSKSGLTIVQPFPGGYSHYHSSALRFQMDSGNFPALALLAFAAFRGCL